jgi:hypothetical protein
MLITPTISQNCCHRGSSLTPRRKTKGCPSILWTRLATRTLVPLGNLALTKTPFPPTTPPATAQQTLDLKTAEVEQTLGYAGKVNGGVLQFSVPRMEKISDSGMEVPPAMGTATAINFQPTGQGKAAISGDFVLLATEVNPVLRALRTHGVEVEAMHNHMLFDEPHLYFMHFWANDDAVKLAQGLRAALNETNSQKPQVK